MLTGHVERQRDAVDRSRSRVSTVSPPQVTIDAVLAAADFLA